MNILSVFYKDKKGGFNRRLYKLYEFLADENHSLYFIGAEPLPIRHKRICDHPIKTPFTNQENAIFWVCFIVSSFLKTLITAKRRKIKRIITFGPFYTVLCSLPILLCKIPAVTFIRADNMKHSRNPLRNIFFYITDWVGVRISDKILTVSSKLKRVYQERYRISGKKIDVLPNSIEERYEISPSQRITIRESLGLEPTDFLISTSGVFSEGKNVSFLISAIKQLYVHGIKLLIIGDEVGRTGERKRLEDLTRDLDLQEHVIFCGWQNDPTRFVASSDLFVFPSKHEGSPSALLEALGCGIPCLGSKIDEIEEILEHDDLLFPLDRVEVLIEKVKSVKFDPRLYDKIKMLSNKRCQHFLFDWGKEVLRLAL